MPTKEISSFYPRPSALIALRSSKKLRSNIHREKFQQLYDQSQHLQWPVCHYKVKASEIGQRAVAQPKQDFNETVLDIMAKRTLVIIPEETLAKFLSLCRHSSFTFGLAGWNLPLKFTTRRISMVARAPPRRLQRRRPTFSLCLRPRILLKHFLQLHF